MGLLHIDLWSVFSGDPCNENLSLVVKKGCFGQTIKPINLKKIKQKNLKGEKSFYK